MFSKSKTKAENKRKNDRPKSAVNDKGNLAQFGLLDINLTMDDIEDNDEEALEAELAALTGGGKNIRPNKKGKKMVSPEELDKMVAECMRDSFSVSDEEDDEILAELEALGPSDEDESEAATPHSVANTVKPPPPSIVHPSPMVAGQSVLTLLKERITLYREAEQNAIYLGEDARARRFNRGLKTLNQMLKSVENGKAINENDIPPAILTKNSRSNSERDISQPAADAKAISGIIDKQHGPSSEKCSSIRVGKDFTYTDISSNVPMDNASLQNTAEMSSICSPSFYPPLPLVPAALPANNFNYPHCSIDSPAIPNLIAPAYDPNLTAQVIASEPIKPNLQTTNFPLYPSESDHLTILLKRQMEYQLAAVSAKRLGDKDMAIKHLMISKQLVPLIESSKKGLKVDLSSLPPSPALSQNHDATVLSVESESNSIFLNTQQDVLVGRTNEPPSVSESLNRRLNVYLQQLEKAKTENNDRKERMNQRIIKQYQEAIKLHQSGKPVPFDELPCPPGFPPLQNMEAAPSPLDPPVVSPHQPPPPPSAVVKTINQQQRDQQAKESVRTAPKSRVERQLSLLQKRQNLFKDAAVEAKRKGEIEQAKEYLRNYKGFDQLITASCSGLPVDMNTVPIPPQEKTCTQSLPVDFVLVNEEDCTLENDSTSTDMAIVYDKLQEDLIGQIKMCAQTREHFKALGDVASANRFENLIIQTKKDLDAVRVALKRRDRPPRFHYENRSFTMIQCNTDLNDSDCEVTVMRGINYNIPNPKEVDTYVRIEFPYPVETPPQEKTDVVKDTNCPEYNHKVVFSIDRKSRALARIFKRQSIKCQIISRGRWFHRDTVIGSIKVPLITLENKCTLHESFDLCDDRKKMIGGKLEVKVRVRNPILSKQLDKVTERWIVIDGF